MLLTEEIEVKIGRTNAKYYKELGYEVSTHYDKVLKRIEFDFGQKINVKVYDLLPSTKAKIDVECDCCHRINKITYQTYLRNLKNDGTYSCFRCNKIKNGTSFYDWCIENNHQDYLDLYDYELNTIDPKFLSKKTIASIYFKCDKGIHKSHTRSLTDLTNDNTSYQCPTCNSFGQWLIDTYGENAIEKYWSNKNTLDPFKTGRASNKKAILICQNCKTEKEISIGTFYRHRELSCYKCGDNISYPNKFMSNLLSQINIEFIQELSKSSSEWCEKYKYDFYIPDYKLIIEMDGGFHYEDTKFSKAKDTKERDNYKDKLALKNGLYVIRINCNYSSSKKDRFEYIKNNIINSNLSNIFDFSSVDWEDVNTKSLKSYLVKACELYNNNNSIEHIMETLKISKKVVINYLKKGSLYKICKYEQDVFNEINRTPILIFKDDNSYIKKFNSIQELCSNSMSDFGFTLNDNYAHKVAIGEIENYKGYKIKFLKGEKKYE